MITSGIPSLRTKRIRSALEKEANDCGLYQGSDHPAEGNPRPAAMAGRDQARGRRHARWRVAERVSVAPTRPRDVFGSLHFEGKARSLAEINAGIAAEAKRRHARNRC